MDITDIIEIILSFLNFDEIMQCQYINKLWHKTCEKNSVWTSLMKEYSPKLLQLNSETNNKVKCYLAYRSKKLLSENIAYLNIKHPILFASRIPNIKLFPHMYMLNTVKEVILLNCNIIDIEYICKMKCIQNLNLSGNNIITIPDNFFNMSELLEANFSNNNIEYLSSNIYTMSNLKSFNIMYNKLIQIPQQLIPSNKIYIYYHGNKIKYPLM